MLSPECEYCMPVTHFGPSANSGYGVQGRSLLPRLANLPQIGGRNNVAMFAWYGQEGGCQNVDGFHVYPKGGDPYGNDVIGAHTRHFGAHVVVSLIDVWVMRDTANMIAPARWLPWFPIDCDPIPEIVLQAIEGAHTPLTYSKWGHELLTKTGVRNRYIPHGVEPTVYKVHDPEEVAKFKREKFGDNCKHLTVMVAANKDPADRKAFAIQLRAWAKFKKDKPGAKLYIHTEPTSRHGGLDLTAIIRHLGIAEDVYFPHQYEYGVIGMSAEYLSMVYNAADAQLAASKSEGFGIPIIEAQACGTPVVTTNYASMPELVRWGYIVDPIDRLWTPLNSWWVVPGANEVADALEQLYAEWHDAGDCWPIEKRRAVSQQIHDEYGWDSIVRDQWQPLVDQLANEVFAAGDMQPAGEKRVRRVAPLVAAGAAA